MKESTYISIGIPFYNAEKYLEEAICSVLAQTHTQWELILINDGSTDNSLKIANKYAENDTRIRVISDGKNKKLPYRLNEIIREAKYDYIARMDADDLMSCMRLEKQMSYLLKNPEVDLVSTGILSLKNDLKIVGYRTTADGKIISKADAIMGTTGIIHASIVARKSWYERNQYNELSMLAEDYELWLNAFIRDDLEVGFIEETLYYYREEQSVMLNKILKAYNTQIEVIKNISNRYISISDRMKYISKIKLKILVVKGLFALKADNLLHKRRVQNDNISKIKFTLDNELKLIKGEKKV